MMGARCPSALSPVRGPLARGAWLFNVARRLRLDARNVLERLDATQSGAGQSTGHDFDVVDLFS
jgi:hypothetical protein